MAGTNLDVLLERQRLGFTLEQPFYIDPEIYRLDLERVLAQQWQYVDHVSRLPEPGDYLTYEIAGESIIVARGNDGELHAHFNVCRHRGSRICLESAGNLRRLVCPYHAWAYGLDGKLESARQMPSVRSEVTHRWLRNGNNRRENGDDQRAFTFLPMPPNPTPCGVCRFEKDS